MSVAESPTAANFLQSLGAAYAAQPNFSFGSHRPPYIPITPEHHAGIRQWQITQYFENVQEDHPKWEFPRALMSEWIAYACLSSPFTNTDYHVGLAPATFESGGEGYKGDDILLSVKNRNDTLDPFLGINVKLQKKKPTRRDERHAYNPLTRSPSIQLSLGDWEIVPREQTETGSMRIRDWLNHMAVPRVIEGDKIPYFHNLRRFIIQRVNNTLGCYLWKADGFVNGEYMPNYQERKLFPDEGGTFTIFYEKLNLAKQLFDEIEEGMNSAGTG